MADQEFLADLDILNIIREVDPSIDIDAYIEIRTLAVGGDTAKASMVMGCTGETAGLVDTQITTDASFLGILIAPVTPADAYDIDDVIVDGSQVYILRPTGGRTKILLTREPTAGPIAVVEGEWYAIGTETGLVRKFTYADTAMATDSFAEKIAQAAEAHAGHATEEEKVLVYY